MSDEMDIDNHKADEVNMYYGAAPKLFQLAKQLRNRTTTAEEILWSKININEWHLKFRRQHPVSVYVADFYCHKIKLVIELDGGHHENREVKIYDEARESDLKQWGITVLRFKNEEVIHNIAEVITKIRSTIESIQKLLEKKVAQKKVRSPNKFSLGSGAPLFVIKIGGNIIDNEANLNSFLKDFASIKEKKILVHGGGKIATKIGEQLGIKSNYINGRRITDEATIDLVTMVYGGLVNKKIVSRLQAHYCNAIGLTGADANIIPAIKRPVKEIDYGFAGDVKEKELGVDTLNILLANNLTPIFAPLTHDGNGQMLNTNADTIASALAVALSEIYDVRLIYCFEKKGVLENVDDDNSVITLITKQKFKQLKQENKLFDGILPKIDNAFAAINSGVSEVLIGDANDLLQNITANTIGTLIK